MELVSAVYKRKAYIKEMAATGQIVFNKIKIAWVEYPGDHSILLGLGYVKLQKEDVPSIPRFSINTRGNSVVLKGFF